MADARWLNGTAHSPSAPATGTVPDYVVFICYVKCYCDYVYPKNATLHRRHYVYFRETTCLLKYYEKIDILLNY